MLKRFRFGSQDSITNPNIIRLAKITNPNPNIRDSEKKIRIRIRIFVTTLVQHSLLEILDAVTQFATQNILTTRVLLDWC